MPLVNAGRDHICGALIGEALTAFNNAAAHLGVGNGITAVAATDTDLVGASKARKAQDAGYPTRTTNQLTFRSTFGTADANFAWDEWAVFNAATAGTMLLRRVQALGTKGNTATWQLTATLTITI